MQQLATAALMGLTLDEAAKVAIVETAGKRLAELVSCTVGLGVWVWALWGFGG